MKKNNKYFFVLLLAGTCCVAKAQRMNWQNLDLERDSTFGISTEKAYNELLKDKSPVPVIVAVIDAGIDTNHEDLKAVLWHDSKPGKFSGNHSWSFIGPVRGNVRYDNLEVTRLVRQQQAKFEGKDTTAFSSSRRITYHAYLLEKADISRQQDNARETIAEINSLKKVMDQICKTIGNVAPSLTAIQKYQPHNSDEKHICEVLLTYLQKEDFLTFKANEIDSALVHFNMVLNCQLNTRYNPRNIVGDNYYNSNQRNYGCSDVMEPDATHGTHVAGIICAIRNNGLGINCVADDVQWMSVRTVPEGDERDKDVANAIRFAADHGAKIINLSFEKTYSQDKKEVDAAVRYAMAKDVLLVQAAGDDNQNIDSVKTFPNPYYENGGKSAAYLVVGASGWKNDNTLKASFSNYGKINVDVFAPSVSIYSCIPGSCYASFDGTSMACPVVSGLAALIREYYPELSAVQVKEIIVKSFVTSPVLAKWCTSGGVINAYRALKLAKQYKRS